MDYGNILRRAWRVTWDHRVLWLFGLLAGLNTRFRFDADNLPPSAQAWLLEAYYSPSFSTVMVALLGFFLLLGVVLVVLKALGRAALVDQVNSIEEGGVATIRSGWEAGKRYVWRVFFISLLLGLPTTVIVIAGLLPLLVPVLRGLPNTEPSGLVSPEILDRFLTCFVPACCLGLILGILLNVIRQLAERKCVLEDKPVWSSIVDGWVLLRSEPGSVAGLWFVSVGVRIGIGIVLGIPACLVALALAAPAASMTQTSALAGGLCCIGVLLWIVGTAVNVLVETFFATYWTLGYRELSAVGPPAEEVMTY